MTRIEWIHNNDDFAYSKGTCNSWFNARDWQASILECLGTVTCSIQINGREVSRNNGLKTILGAKRWARKELKRFGVFGRHFS